MPESVALAKEVHNAVRLRLMAELLRRMGANILTEEVPVSVELVLKILVK